MRRVLDLLLVVALSVVAAVAYGIAHDLVTAHVCVEYFTIGHAGGPATDAPLAHALYWGVAATWWMGAGLGLLLGLSAVAGPCPARRPRDLLRPLAVLLLVMGAGALVAGLLGGWLASTGAVVLVGAWAERVPRGCHVRFLADLWAHNASYLLGGLGGLVLCVLTLRARLRADRPRG